MLAPIPGMSLTKEPRNQPWEAPPLYAKKEEALAFYLEKLSDKETLDDMLFILKRKFPVESFVEAMTSFGVMEGYHTVDVKVIISPVLHQHIMTLCDTLGIKVVEWSGPTDEEKQSAKDKERMKILIEEALDDPTPIEELDTQEATQELAAPKSKSLIKKREPM